MKGWCSFDELRSRVASFIAKFTGSKRMMTAAAVLGFAGMLMILFSGGNDDESKNTAEAVSISENNLWSQFSCDEEQRLEKILSAINGVGRVEVMITCGSTEEYIYAEVKNSDGDRKEQEYVIIENQSGEEALLRKIRTPEIAGVLVVCEGAGSDRVKEDVYKAVTSVLDISSDKVFVTRME